MVRSHSESRCIGQTSQLAILMVRSHSESRCIGQTTQLAILMVRNSSEPRCIGESTQLGHPNGQEPYEEPRPVVSSVVSGGYRKESDWHPSPAAPGAGGRGRPQGGIIIMAGRPPANRSD
jgi:hypothetical protein